MPIPLSRLQAKKNDNSNYRWMTLQTARVLQVLKDAKDELKLLTRNQIKPRAGFSPVSGSLSRVLSGIREGSSSGAPRPGALDLGWIRKYEMEVDGIGVEESYEITTTGEEMLAAWVKEKGELPPIRDPELSKNNRYKED